ncbi:MAG: OmpA family protein, partial [Proteobacteria bacterium]|nr:OmpA family protein [Pseudomonadota bacterium]
GRRTRWLFILLIGLLLVSQAFAAGESELQVRAGKPGAIVTLERQLNDGMVQLSVSDAANRPIIGMTKDDFVVTASGRTARIISAQLIANSLDVPRNIVMVLDNSDSMSHRSAVKPLLAGVDELLKIVRPIDQVQIVVFSGKEKMTMGGRDLRVRTFKSNNPGELRNFVHESYRDGMTQTTVLNEGMLAGLELIRTMPANEPRFMVVFSDGEDINSEYKENEVTRVAEGVGRFNAYAIDYMPDAATDKFLMAFAEQNRGQIWKAKSETSLVPIFQSVASKMQYFYVVTYLFPTSGSLAVAPASVTINELAAIDLSSQPERSAGVAPAKHASGTSRIDTSALTLRPVVDTAYSFARWKIILANSRGTLVEKDGEGIPPAEIVVPLKTDDLGLLAAGGDIKVSMEVQDSKGQSIILTAPPVKVNYFKTTGSLAVAPASLTIEEIKTIDSSPMLGYIYFLKGASDLSAQYVRLAGPGETTTYDEQRFRDTLEKYYQVLNIIGKRLTDHPAATITLTGCNDNTGTEKRNLKLSTARAEAVRDYLQSVWNIASDRIRTDARNLPEIPSTNRLEEGRAENRRVEIRADDSSILAPVRSTYMSVRIDADALTLRPAVNAPHNVANWTVRAANKNGSLGELSGEGAPPAEIRIPMRTRNLNEMSIGGDITITMVVKDREGQILELAAGPVKVNFIQTSQRLAQKQDFRVQEKYALILFDFDSDAISARNQEIVNAIVARIRELSQTTAEIVGHTDTIGKEDYNIKLSQRRALSAYKLLSAAYGVVPSDHIRHSGVGPNDPLFDNITPEARALNRTVIITLEYMAGN